MRGVCACFKYQSLLVHMVIMYAGTVTRFYSIETCYSTSVGNPHLEKTCLHFLCHIIQYPQLFLISQAHVKQYNISTTKWQIPKILNLSRQRQQVKAKHLLFFFHFCLSSASSQKSFNEVSRRENCRIAPCRHSKMSCCSTQFLIFVRSLLAISPTFS